MSFENATYATKSFLSALPENAASAAASVITEADDFLLAVDSTLTLVNAQGNGAQFAFSHAYDTHTNQSFPANDYDSIDEMKADIQTLLLQVQEWGIATLSAIDSMAVAIG